MAKYRNAFLFFFFFCSWGAGSGKLPDKFRLGISERYENMYPNTVSHVSFFNIFFVPK